MHGQPSPAEDLPRLYRAILDGVAGLERLGYYREAGLLRAEATRAYSTAWDDRATRRLSHVRRRIDRVAAGDERARTQPGGWPDLRRSLLPR